ncbi:MAG: glycosyltransferase [Patescibacteria group bacterium]
MKLLICTQIYDANDSDLGFFVRWVEEFKKHCEVEVISLKNLGRGGRLMRAWRLLKLVSHKEYDAVFVHMNPEYLLAVGWYWKLHGKKTSLWYTHKSVNLKLRVATWFADIIFTASKESFRLPSKKVRVMGHGIDTDLFRPDPSVVREGWWLSAGRLNKSKRHDLVIDEAAKAGKELRIAGEGPERKNLEVLAHTLGARVVFLGGVSHSQMPDLFRRAGLFRHTSETGSLDKVLLEAIACGCPIQTNNLDLKALESENPAGIFAEHSLQALITKIVGILQRLVVPPHP